VNNEIVWVTSDGVTYTVNRASPTGANSRSLTSFAFPDDGSSWQLVDSGNFPGQTDRIFYTDYDSTSGKAKLYYIATDVTNAAGVSVATISGSNAWAVGMTRPSTCNPECETLILHWNGTAWSTTPTGMTDTLINVWGSGPSDVWAVGYSATNAGSVLHWNGTTWSAVPNVSAMALFGVWESGPSDVWAVGNQGTTVHWNGTAWSTVPSGTTQYLVRVWGSGSGDVWTVGNGGALLHWTGTAWSSVVAPTTSALSGVWGSAAGDVWTVGDAALGSVFHWNGSGWSSVSIGPLL